MAKGIISPGGVRERGNYEVAAPEPYEMLTKATRKAHRETHAREQQRYHPPHEVLPPGQAWNPETPRLFHPIAGFGETG